MPRWRNPFVYPAGVAPCINRSHPAFTRNLRLAVVATGHKMMQRIYPDNINATSIGSNSTNGINGLIGPFLQVGPFSECRFNTVFDDKIGSAAAIMVGPSSFDPSGAGFYHMISNSSFSGGGYQFSWNTSDGQFFLNAPNGGTPFNWTWNTPIVTVPIRQPFFIAFSYQESGPAVMVMRNLVTGTLIARPSNANGGTLNTTDGKLFLGGAAFNAAGGDEQYHCGMWSGDYLPLSTLIKWSEYPFDFWYQEPKTRRAAAQSITHRNRLLLTVTPS